MPIKMELKQGDDEKLRDFVRVINVTFRKKFGLGIGHRNPFAFYAFRRRVKTKCFLNGIRQEIANELPQDLKYYIKANLNWNDLVEVAQDAEWLWSLRYRKERAHSYGVKTCRHNSQDFKVDEDGFVVVYTDGACSGNGQTGAKAGLGVWFGEGHDLNVSEPLSKDEPATNNVAEIKAVIEALTILKQFDVSRVAIHTDSQYMINSVTNWIFTWLTNGWLKSDSTPLKHKKQYREMLLAMEDMSLKWVFVRGHCSSDGNIQADRLARKGAREYATTTRGL